MSEVKFGPRREVNLQVEKLEAQLAEAVKALEHAKLQLEFYGFTVGIDPIKEALAKIKVTP